MWPDQGLCAVRGEETLRTLMAWVGWGLVGKDRARKRDKGSSVAVVSGLIIVDFLSFLFLFFLANLDSVHRLYQILF